MTVQTYKRLAAEFYDLATPTPPETALSFLLEELQPVKGPVLEPMCGSGRFLIPLLQRGVDVEGVDSSVHMLDRCRARCARERLKPVLYEAYLESMDLPRKYAAAFILGGSIGHLTETSLAVRGLDQVSSCLLYQGSFIIEIWTPTGKLGGVGRCGSTWVWRPDGTQVARWFREEYDCGERVGRTAFEYQIVMDGQAIEEESEICSMRYYTVTEFRDLLTDAGFSEIRCVRPYGDTPATELDGTAVFVCRKM